MEKNSMSDDALAQAKALLTQLTEDAKKGAIIPFRLPGQLEEILAAMERTGADGGSASSGGGGDVEAFKKDLAGVLSHGFHDLRLPLTSIRGYSDMLGTPSMGELNPMQQ